MNAIGASIRTDHTSNMNHKATGRCVVQSLRLWAVVLAIGFAYCANGANAANGPDAAARERDPHRVAILAYHRFGPEAVDSMTVRVTTFEAQLNMLREHGYTFVALRDVVHWVADANATLPAKAVALTADDGHRSVYDVLRPIALRERLPFTLFVYPSAISNAAYALTWTQLRELHHSGLFDVQSHTYWHPNFNTERAHRTPEDFRQFATQQLTASRERIESELGTPVDMLAWPFGIVDEDLIALASGVGYRSAFTIAGHVVDRRSPVLALPRLLITDADSPAVLARRLGEAPSQATTERRPMP